MGRLGYVHGMRAMAYDGILFSPMAGQPLGGLGRLIFRGFAITHFLDTPHLVGLLWTRDQLVAETYEGIAPLIFLFLTSTSDGGKWTSLWHEYPAHCIRRRVDARASPDNLEQTKCLAAAACKLCGVKL